MIQRLSASASVSGALIDGPTIGMRAWYSEGRAGTMWVRRVDVLNQRCWPQLAFHPEPVSSVQFCCRCMRE